MDAELQRIQALPGDAAYAVTFVHADGSEVTTVVRVRGETVELARASLPGGWCQETSSLAALEAAVLALHAARVYRPPGGALRDVAGGWDVALGNVEVAAGAVRCSAHGRMALESGVYTCPECGARAVLI